MLSNNYFKKTLILWFKGDILTFADYVHQKMSLPVALVGGQYLKTSICLLDSLHVNVG